MIVISGVCFISVGDQIFFLWTLFTSTAKGEMKMKEGIDILIDN